MATHQQISKEILNGGRSLWLAGLGAVATVGASSRSGFETCVSLGRQREQRERDALDATLNAVSDRVRDLGEQVNTSVHSTMSTALQRMGVPTRDEIQSLIEHVETLTGKLEALRDEK